MNRYQAAILVVVLPAAVLAVVSAGGQSRKPNEAAAFMRLKLDHAQQLLEAIAIEDFDGISRNSQKISLLTQDENWQVFQTVEYRRYSDDFRRAANAVTEAARKKNLDGAMLAYLQMTMKCFECHKHVRGEKPKKKPAQPQ
jgi:cytochrome c556